MNKMKAVLLYQAGSPEQFVIEEREIPSIKEGWTLVKVKGFGINHSEIFTRQGLSPTVSFPRILGIECVGEVVQTSRSDLEKGQKIVSIMGEMGRVFDGSYAEYVLLPNQQVYPITSSLSWTDLAAVPETYYTAFGAFKNLKIESQDRILIRGASSGVGLAFLRLVKAQFPQLKVYASGRDRKKEASLLVLGFDGFIEDKDYQLQTSQNFSKNLELIGPRSLKNSLAYLEEGGIVCSLGQLGGQWYLEDFDPIMELQKNVYLTTFYSGNVSQVTMQALFDYIDYYQVSVSPERVYSLEQIAQAHRDLEESHSYGKSVILLD